MLLPKRMKRKSQRNKVLEKMEKNSIDELLLLEKKDIICTEEEICLSILKPKNLWIADTRICTLYRQEGNFKTIHSEKGRNQIPVFYIGDAFVELSKHPGELNLVRCHKLGIAPTKEKEEYVNFETSYPFPFNEEDWFDYEHATLESLKEVFDIHKMKKYLQNHQK